MPLHYVYLRWRSVAETYGRFNVNGLFIFYINCVHLLVHVGYNSVIYPLAKPQVPGADASLFIPHQTAPPPTKKKLKKLYDARKVVISHPARNFTNSFTVCKRLHKVLKHGSSACTCPGPHKRVTKQSLHTVARHAH
jgi:hypothetical protein